MHGHHRDSLLIVIRSHFTKFLCYLDTLDLDFKIIGLSETSINEIDINYNIPKYNYELNCRQRRKRGGVNFYIHSLLQYKTRLELQLGWGSKFCICRDS